MNGPVYAPRRARLALPASRTTRFGAATAVQTIADRLDLILAWLQT